MGIFNLASPPEIGMQSVKVGIFNNKEKALVTNLSEYCENFRKISLTSLLRHTTTTSTTTQGRGLIVELMLCNHRVFVTTACIHKQISKKFSIPLSQTSRNLNTN